MTLPKKHSISIDGHKTSYTLESIFFDELCEIAKRKNTSLAKLVTDIDHARNPEQNLSSALRVFIFKQVKNTASEN